MRLHTTIEKRLAVNEDEVRLSDRSRKRVFKGFYMFAGKIVNVEATRNYENSTSKNFPYQTKITRETSGGTQSFSGNSILGPVFKDSSVDVAEEMENPLALNRANRVEKVARRTKIIAGLSALASVVTGITVLAATSESKPKSVIEVCDTTAKAGDAFIPVAADQVDPAQAIGEEICTFKENYYLIIRRPEI